MAKYLKLAGIAVLCGLCWTVSFLCTGLLANDGIFLCDTSEPKSKSRRNRR